MIPKFNAEKNMESTKEILIKALRPHLLNTEERCALGHPLLMDSGVQFYYDTPKLPSRAAEKCNVDDPEWVFVPEVVCKAGPALRRRCARCDELFIPGQDAGCLYHWGRVTNRIYNCCGTFRGTLGCSKGRHVWSGTTLGWNGPFQHYAAPYRMLGGVYAIDTEMVYTEAGLELARVALTDVKGQLVFDSLVRPSAPVVDYNTKYSGITSEQLKLNPKSLKEVWNDLFDIVGFDTILVGHALENDLRALRIVHERVIDTCALFPHHKGLPWKQSLRNLSENYLGHRIQCSNDGHCPAEDARAAMNLVLWKVSGLRRTVPTHRKAWSETTSFIMITAATFLIPLLVTIRYKILK